MRRNIIDHDVDTAGISGRFAALEERLERLEARVGAARWKPRNRPEKATGGTLFPDCAE